jgi:Putative bacterial sensory transduction regulator
MKKVARWSWLGMAALAVLAPAGATTAQTKEEIFHSVQAKQIESIFNELDIKFVKNQPKQAPDDTDFDFERKGFKIRFTLSKGKMLWLSSYFPKAPLERLNQWNVNAKFSRALLDRVGDREYSIVEWQLDAAGGVTKNMIRQFIARFEDEVVRFDQFLSKA